MVLDWNLVLDQLKFIKEKEGAKFKDLEALTIDTLHGSMYGLNYRFQTLLEAFTDKGKRKAIIDYSVSRIEMIIDEPNFSYKKRKPERCRVGIGTYRWDYNPELINKAIKIGVSLIDTAEGYGYGRVEERLGEVLQGSNQVNVFTKVRRDHMSPNAITNAMNRSLIKLKVKPHFQLHFPHNKYPDAVKYLADYNRAGKVASIGLGNCSIDMIEYSQRLINPYGIINSVQLPFSLIDSRIKDTVIKYCKSRGILVIAYSPLGQDFRKLDSKVLKRIAKKYKATTAQVALSWILSHKGVLPIPQTNNVDHLTDNLLSNELILDKKDKRELENYYTKNHIC